MDLLNKLTQKVKQKTALKSKVLKDIERSKFLATIPTDLLKRCVSNCKVEQDRACNEVIALHKKYCEENNIKDNFM
nr:MAG TPA: cationic trypsin [Caudoviricetes sp.]